MKPTFILLLGSCVALAGCRERTHDVEVPAEAGFRLSEARTSGALAAPDSVKVYAGPRQGSETGSGVIILEGQDVGKICYTWIDPATLQLSISGGYLDRVASEADVDGQIVQVRFVGVSPDCRWRSGDPA